LALPQVRIGDVVEYRPELLERPLDRPFGVDPLLADERGGAAHEHRVLEDEQLRVEDRGELRPTHLGDAGPDLLQLLAGARPCALERGELPCHALARHGKTNNLRPLDRDQRGSQRDAVRDSYSLQPLHVSSPNPDATSPQSASTALTSSGPS